jgi:hypothetical protein
MFFCQNLKITKLKREKKKKKKNPPLYIKVIHKVTLVITFF